MIASEGDKLNTSLSTRLLFSSCAAFLMHYKKGFKDDPRLNGKCLIYCYFLSLPPFSRITEGSKESASVERIREKIKEKSDRRHNTRETPEPDVNVDNYFEEERKQRARKEM